ncbi:MAG: ATP-dependent helicase RecG [Actinomycetota bacterium]|jgi:ATP-dependent DNA helicase RecG|nr:ATP-dependent helicase RecG [Actinomycetota bacterium]
MSEVVDAPPKGLELFAAPRRRKSLPPKRGEALQSLGIDTVQDLLQHYPRRHVDRTQLRTVAQLKEQSAQEDLGEVTVHAKVVQMGRPFELRGRTKTNKKRIMIKGKVGDETGSIDVTWFNQQWVARALRVGVEAFFYGRLSTFKGKLQMTAPRWELIRTGEEPFHVGRIVPIYPATADTSSDKIRRYIWDALEGIDQILDPLPETLRHRLGLMGRDEALRTIHFPENKDDVLAARRRLAFDELLSLQLGLVYRKRKLERTVQGISHPHPDADSLAETFVNSLPFELTGDQRVACDDVASDMQKQYPMHRLVEGEVGSGKTVVALYACLLAIGGGHQAAFMAPTEVLAEQHHLTVNDLLDRAFGADEARNLFASVSQRPVVRLLTGSTPATERAQILADVASGEVGLLLGTHALIQESVEFRNLGVAIVDEQHRFGVHQRKSLREKGRTGEPDVLVMTATAIPRTLAVTIYGDLDLSILRELPAGRLPIATSTASGDDERERAYELIRKEVAGGRQAFIVYALRDESDKLELRSAKGEAARLAKDVFPDLVVGLVHGDMKSIDKEQAMTDFRSGKTQVLVATTVIEVGVDVPNATVMLVENSERFGLAQLHQLRGRIGRGGFDSYCILATDLDLDSPEEAAAIAAERLSTVVSTRDGFALAEADLKQRGEGQILGARQSGLPELKIARVLTHREEIKMARSLAEEILDEDPDLGAWEHAALAREVRDRFPEEAVDIVQSG